MARSPNAKIARTWPCSPRRLVVDDKRRVSGQGEGGETRQGKERPEDVVEGDLDSLIAAVVSVALSDRVGVGAIGEVAILVAPPDGDHEVSRARGDDRDRVVLGCPD